jgi:hypothetical protein
MSCFFLFGPHSLLPSSSQQQNRAPFPVASIRRRMCLPAPPSSAPRQSRTCPSQPALPSRSSRRFLSPHQRHSGQPTMFPLPPADGWRGDVGGVGEGGGSQAGRIAGQETGGRPDPSLDLFISFWSCGFRCWPATKVTGTDQVFFYAHEDTDKGGAGSPATPVIPAKPHYFLIGRNLLILHNQVVDEADCCRSSAERPTCILNSYTCVCQLLCFDWSPRGFGVSFLLPRDRFPTSCDGN